MTERWIEHGWSWMFFFFFFSGLLHLVGCSTSKTVMNLSETQHGTNQQTKKNEGHIYVGVSRTSNTTKYNGIWGSMRIMVMKSSILEVLFWICDRMWYDGMHSAAKWNHFFSRIYNKHTAVWIGKVFSNVARTPDITVFQATREFTIEQSGKVSKLFWFFAAVVVATHSWSRSLMRTL